MSRKCALVLLNEVERFYCDLVPSNEDRSSLVELLIRSFGVDKKVRNLTVSKLSKSDLYQVGDRRFVEFLLKRRPWVDEELEMLKTAKLKLLCSLKDEIFNSSGRSNDDGSSDFDTDDGIVHYQRGADDDVDDEKELATFGLLYDCPLFPYMAEYVKIVVGSTLSAVEWLVCESKLNQEDKLISMNWLGGRHHGLRDKASGFCYVNDIVFGINRLRLRFPKVMYIDLDLHHGDGVSRLFKASSKVLTLSIHRYDIGFFPGSGDISRDRGIGNGFGYDVNLPMRKGLSSSTLMRMVESMVIPLIGKFQPNCLVIQCGCDGLNTDGLKEWNLSIKGMTRAIDTILQHSGKIPALLLGGGGYNHTEAAKFWTYLTAVVSGQDTSSWDLIPDHELSDSYQDYQFWANERELNMKDLNDDEEWLQFLSDDVMSRGIH